MNKFIVSLLILVFVFSSSDLSAQRRLGGGNRKAMLDSLSKLSPDQKKEMREKMKARYDSLSPEQKEKVKERIMERADSLSPKQKARLKERLKNNTTNNG